MPQRGGDDHSPQSPDVMPSPSTLRRRCAAVFALAVVALTSSCSGGGTEPNTPFGGDYFLKSVNSVPLPRTITISGGTVQLISLRLSILADSSYTETAVYKPLTYTGDVQTEAAGTWIHTETGAVILQDQAGLAWASGAESGNTLTLRITPNSTPVETWVFRR